MSKEEGGGGGSGSHESQAQYVGPYRLEKTLGKGQTGWCATLTIYFFFQNIGFNFINFRFCHKERQKIENVHSVGK